MRWHSALWVWNRPLAVAGEIPQLPDGRRRHEAAPQPTSSLATSRPAHRVTSSSNTDTSSRLGALVPGGADRSGDAERRAHSNSSWCRDGPSVSLINGLCRTKESRARPGAPDSHPSWWPPTMAVLSAEACSCGQPDPAASDSNDVLAKKRAGRTGVISPSEGIRWPGAVRRTSGSAGRHRGDCRWGRRRPGPSGAPAGPARRRRSWPSAA